MWGQSDGRGVQYLDDVSPAHGVFVLVGVGHILKEMGHGALLDVVVWRHRPVEKPARGHDAAIDVIDLVVLDRILSVNQGFHAVDGAG